MEENSQKTEPEAKADICPNCGRPKSGAIGFGFTPEICLACFGRGIRWAAMHAIAEERAYLRMIKDAKLEDIVALKKKLDEEWADKEAKE